MRGQDNDAPLDPRILAYDKGPAKIDVSKYPADMKANYKVFAIKCSKCHTIARAINCEFALEDEWERYVKRMMRKRGKLITCGRRQADLRLPRLRLEDPEEGALRQEEGRRLALSLE